MSGELSRYRDFLRARRSGDRILVGPRFSARVHNGREAHSASYTMNTGTFPTIKRPGRGVDYTSLPSAEVKEKIELYIYTPCETSWPVLGLFCLYHFNIINVSMFHYCHGTVKHASSRLQIKAI